MTTGSEPAGGCGRPGAPSAMRPSGSTWWQPTGMLGRCCGSGASCSGGAGAGVCVPVDERGRGVGCGVPGASTRGVRLRERCVRCRLHGVPARATLARE